MYLSACVCETCSIDISARAALAQEKVINNKKMKKKFLHFLLGNKTVILLVPYAECQKGQTSLKI